MIVPQVPAAASTGKGRVAGLVSAALATVAGATAPSGRAVTGATVVGFLGYGVSLVLFILALRHVGTARAGAYFSVAPFFGASVAVLAGQDAMTPSLGLAAAPMGLGVWLQVSEHHAHAHRHEPVEHAHAHIHDVHHGHEHAFPWDGAEPHVHAHVHHAMTHSHLHYPDVHHRPPHWTRPGRGTVGRFPACR